MSRPTAAQLIAFLVDIEDDPARTHQLATGWTLFEAVRDGGLVGAGDIDGLAIVVHDLVSQDLLRYRSRSAGVVEPPPSVPWNGARMQEHHGFHTTDRGRADAERYHRRQRERQAPPDDDRDAAGDPRDALGRWFQQLHFVFPLPAGAKFPPLDWRPTADEHARLNRFVRSAQELAESSIFTGSGFGYRVQFTPGGIDQLESAMPTGEQMRGVAALFRQLYANEEPASFAVTSGILRRATEEHVDEQTPARREMLNAWREAQGKLRGRWLEGLMIERGQELGDIPLELRQPNASITPEQILKAYFYGDHLHWDRGADDLERWRADPFRDAHHGLLFLRALGQLSTLYIGFAALMITAAALKITN